MSLDDSAGICPVPIRESTVVSLAHGGGGRMMRRLIEEIFLPAFDSPLLNRRHDNAVIEIPAVPQGKARLAFTTDSFVVSPLFFPGGDIGALAVNGTVNDLAMSGARPLYLSAGFILEEGLAMDTVVRVARSMKQAADAAGVQVVTGDTKVVQRGKGDGMFINTSGIGVIEHGLAISPFSVTPGDAVLLNGDIGRHGVAVMAAREGLSFETDLESDTAPLADLILSLIAGGIEIHCLRDLTRGGLASALFEIAQDSGTRIHIEETAIPVLEAVAGVCELLGLEPASVANEGRFVAFVPNEQAERCIELMRAHPLGQLATVIGHVHSPSGPRLTMTSSLGTTRIVILPEGEQLPRIC